MKIKIVFFVLFFTSVCFAQSVSYQSASRRTAERCLKLSENYLLAGDTEAALNQAELALSYDDSISDLYYIKAVCLKNKGESVRRVMELSEAAKEKNTWIGYNEKGNRILLADLLSDTGSYDEALAELDHTPFVFSADAEAIRVKTYYRQGTDESLLRAREKINSARRIYKGDLRFVNLFYNFEFARVLQRGKSYIPEVKVLQIADVLSQELKNYSNLSAEVESLSLFFTGFTDSEKQIRGLKAFNAAGKSDVLFPVTALMSGYWNEEKAFSEFFNFASKSVSVDLLEYFVSLIETSEVTEKLYECLNAYEGVLYVDVNKDLQWELEISYERGRPQYVQFDAENDGIEDLYGVMDYGELLSVNIKPLETELFYSDFPYLGRANVHYESSLVFFDFAKEAVAYSPLKFEVYFEEKFPGKENKFYIPAVKSSWKDLSNLDYLANATFIKLQSAERENSFVTYSLLDGNVISAVYVADGKVYASADFVNSLPVDRYADYDNDGVFETHEIFTEYTEDNKNLFAEQDFLFVNNLFPFFRFSESVFLSVVEIDSDNDNVPEYREYFREKGGKTSVWVKSDGRTESYSRFPRNENDPLVEESVFVVGQDRDTVSVLVVDGEPSSVKINDRSFKVFKGELPDLYWIEENGNGDIEVLVAKKIQAEENGVVISVEKDNGGIEPDFYNAIKMADKIFVRKISLSKLEKDYVLDNDMLSDEKVDYEENPEISENE